MYIRWDVEDRRDNLKKKNFIENSSMCKGKIWGEKKNS